MHSRTTCARRGARSETSAFSGDIDRAAAMALLIIATAVHIHIWSACSIFIALTHSFSFGCLHCAPSLPLVHCHFPFLSFVFYFSILLLCVSRGAHLMQLDQGITKAGLHSMLDAGGRIDDNCGHPGVPVDRGNSIVNGPSCPHCLTPAMFPHLGGHSDDSVD